MRRTIYFKLVNDLESAALNFFAVWFLLVGYSSPQIFAVCFRRSKLDELRQGFDETLFHSSRYNPHHVLPQPKDTGHSLRQRTHNLTLPSDVGSTTRQNFITRMLFTDMY